jgi:hypothetical protein
MLGRLLAIIVGIGAAIGASQGPGFTLQYMQNLTGRIDELRPIVEQFDADVGKYGYTRQAAMAECETADGLLDALCSSYETVVARFEALSSHFNELSAASDYVRPLVLARSYRTPMVREIAESVYSVFEPAIPATPVGFAYGGGGFVVGWGLLSFVFGLLGAMFGGGRRYA